MGRVLGGIDWVRDGYAAVVRRLVRVAVLSLVAVAGVRRRHLRRVADHADRVPARGGPGRVLHRGAAARRRLGGAHQRSHQAGRGHAEDDAAGRARARRSSASRCSTAATSRTRAFMVARLKPFADRTAAADSAQALIRQIFGERSADPPGQRPAVQPAADHRPVDQRRLRIPARGAGRTGPGRDWAASMGGADRRRQPGSAADARVLDLHRHQSVDLSRHRPRQGAGARPQHERRLHRAAGDAGRHLRQQFQPASAAPGRSTSRARPPIAATFRDIWQIYVRNSTGEMVPMRSIASMRIVIGPQVITRYNNYRSITINGGPAPGVSSGTALAAMAGLSDTTLPAGYGYRMDRHRLSGAAGRRPDRRHPRRWPCCSPTCSWWRCTRAG